MWQRRKDSKMPHSTDVIEKKTGQPLEKVGRELPKKRKHTIGGTTYSIALVYRDILKDYPDVLTFEDMCSVLSISPVTGYKLLKDGKIAHIRIGRIYRIPKLHLLNYLVSKKA